jgi:tetratricopeptide (TPR) repeat protein
MTNASDDKRHFFISFTGADRPWARWFARTLAEEGYTYWFQDQDFAGSIPRSIAEAHERSERTILLLSDAYACSGFCRSEWEARYMDDPGSAKDLLIPFRVGPCVVTDPLLARIAFQDLFDKDEAAARELVRHRLRQALERGYRVPLGREPFPGGRPEAPYPIPVHNLPLPSVSFVGRQDELEELARRLAEGGRTAITQPRRAITGLGGIGKTQLALRYAYTHLADYDLIRWLRAEEPASLATGYTGLAAPLGLDPATPDRPALIEAIRAKLERTPRWLLVFDNATSPATLDLYLPRLGTGHVLITSRWQHWEGMAGVMDLDVLPEDDAVRLFLGVDEADPARREEARQLAEDLGRLPLALAQARAYARRLKVDLATYRRRFAESRAKVLAWRPKDADYPLAVAQAWQTSAAAAASEHAGAGPLLELLAFFAPDSLPRAVLRAVPDVLVEPLRDEQDLDEAIAVLDGFSLARATPDTLTTHRLVQAVTRDRLDATTAKARAEAAIRLVNAALPRPPQEHTNWLAMGRLLPHALAATEAAERLGAGLEAAARVLNQTAVYHYARAAWAETESLLRRAITIDEKALGPDHPHLAIRFNNLALLYKATSRYAEAEPFLQRAIAIDEKAYGPEHPEVAVHLSNLATLYWATGRYAETESLLRRAIAIDEKALAPEHPNLATRFNNLALISKELGRAAEAEPLFKRAIAIGEKTLGPEHPELATWLCNLANLYRDTSRYAEAKPFFERALAITEKTLGPEHPSLAIRLSSLAALYWDTGRYAEAEPLFERAITIHQKAFSSNHPDFARSLNNTAMLYRKTSRYAEAEPLLQRAIAIGEKTFSHEHPDFGTWLCNLANLYRDTSRYAEAEPLYRRALTIFEKVLPVDHPEQANVREYYADLLDRLGRGEEAAALRAQAAGGRPLPGPREPSGTK